MLVSGDRVRTAVERLRQDVALWTDVLAQDLAERLSAVAWDRARVVGWLLAGLDELLARPPPERPADGAHARVHERADQPFEAWVVACRALLAGRAVVFSWDPPAEGPARTLLEQLAERLPSLLTLAGAGPAPEDDPAFIGPARAAERVAFVRARADRELAAYVLARACLRRSGRDPRAVRLAWVEGDPARLTRYLRRLFVETLIGPPDDPTVFSGPVDPATRDAYLACIDAWSQAEGVQTLVPGALLARAGDPRTYLAPALFAAPAEALDRPRAGPMLVLVSADAGQVQAAMARARRRGTDVLVVLGGALGPDDHGLLGPRVTPVLGALLTDRLPPGLPEPRPV